MYDTLHCYKDLQDYMRCRGLVQYFVADFEKNKTPSAFQTVTAMYNSSCVAANISLKKVKEKQRGSDTGM